eukprot:5036695-Amphidinium_carterae.2
MVAEDKPDAAELFSGMPPLDTPRVCCPYLLGRNGHARHSKRTLAMYDISRAHFHVWEGLCISKVASTLQRVAMQESLRDLATRHSFTMSLVIFAYLFTVTGSVAILAQDSDLPGTRWHLGCFGGRAVRFLSFSSRPFGYKSL